MFGDVKEREEREDEGKVEGIDRDTMGFMASANGGQLWHRRRNRAMRRRPCLAQYHLPSSCHQEVERVSWPLFVCSGWIVSPSNAQLITMAPVPYLHKRQKAVLFVATTHQHILPLARDTITLCGEIAEKLTVRLDILTSTGIIIRHFIKSCPDPVARGWNIERWTKVEI